jgi:short-subunit dehydrogenase
MMNVHFAAPVSLCRAALPGMVAKGEGSIINVASIAAFLPTGHALYDGTKAGLVAFSKGLQHELPDGIRIQALCPGLTITEFHDHLPGVRPPHTPQFFWRSAEEVVDISLAALGRGRVLCIPGWENKLAVWLATNRLTSPFFAASVKRDHRRRRK